LATEGRKEKNDKNIYWTTDTKHINTLCWQNVELLNVKLAVYIVTTGV
jgi:hypothetical protein